MLGSLVRVSRRVAWMTDLLPLDELASTQSRAYRQLTSTRFLSRSKERDIHPQTCLAQDPGPPAKQHPTSGGTRNPDQQGATEPSNMGITLDKRPESQLSSYLPIPRFTAVSTKLILISQRIRTRGWEMHRQAAIQTCKPRHSASCAPQAHNITTNTAESLSRQDFVGPCVYPQAVSRPFELSLQSSLQLSLTVLVCYQLNGNI